jgi:predicted Zn-ribbon and HTH transcriptional regulator
MTTREKVHKLLDELPESQLEPVAEILASRRENEDKPGDIIDDWGNLSAMTRASSRRMLKRLDEEEMAEHGETIADAFARAERESPK